MTNLDEAQRVERDVFVYRAFIEQGRAQIVRDEIKEDTEHTSLQAVRLLARDALGENVMGELKAMLENSVAQNNPTLQLVASQLYSKEGNTDEALRVLHSSRALEAQAQMALLYMSINRGEHAEKEYKSMAREEEHVLTTLTGARLLLWQGGAKRAQEALGMVEDLVDKHGATALLLNTCATAYMVMGQWEYAEQSLKDAQTKEPGNVATLLGLAACYGQQGKSQLAARATAQARQSKHGLAVQLERAEAAFDEACK